MERGRWLQERSRALRDHNQLLIAHSQKVCERSSLAVARGRTALQRSLLSRRSLSAGGNAGEGAPAVGGVRLMHHAARGPTLAGRLIAAQEEERRRIALELHDAVSQRVAATCISLRRLQLRLRDDAAARQQLEEVLDVLGELVHGVRHLAHAMHPPVLDLAGLGAALRGHCHELRTLAHFEVAVTIEELSVPPDAALCLYRVAQAALANVLAHAGVMRATLGVARQGGGVVLTVSDRGKGFDPARVQPGLGLVGMAERARLAGGTLAVDSRPGAGTVIRAWVPLAGPAPAPDDEAAAPA